MKRQIIITLILLAATVMITLTYFKHLNPPGKRVNQVVNTIPASAAFIFQFNNDSSFYDIYSKSELFSSITGKQKMRELDALRHTLLGYPLLKEHFSAEDIFISIHPQATDSLDYLLTVPASSLVDQGLTEWLKSKTAANIKLSSLNISGKKAYSIHIDSLDKNFFFANRGSNIWIGSFSRALIEEDLKYKPSEKSAFSLLPDQQNSTLLSSLYINYSQLNPLLAQLYKTDNTDLWKGLDLLPATTALSLNYKSDALMFNGFTSVNKNKATSYLNLFTGMKPVPMSLVNLFPVTTAYSNSYAVDDMKHFLQLLAAWQQKAGFDKEKSKLFSQIKAETGVQLDKEFKSLIDNEFAVVTTRFQERLAIIKVKNGASLRPFFNNVSNMVNDEIGQLNYNQVPLFLLGDALAPFRRPYFMIMDNYMVLANTQRELSNYKENYLNNAFISKGEEFIEFNNLTAQRCNVSFFIHFKNAGSVFKQTLKKPYAKAYQQQPGFKNYYAASYQLSASDNQFYTNLCVKLITPDTTTVRK
ncbi:hypothetical protein MUGA111182_15740 [Mucilaginibacter galii]|uniref:DUF3352 domain-containing protein n=1 Tax=Mucilaginibacter galii TaxID=2005073 RepID=A0A917N169_9SPHI|nr:hypothetical protein [Mucilaginibacter galii]GGI50553.1 hypothetical protein GCM10011425_17650 [Mucilaginibacter galii]